MNETYLASHCFGVFANIKPSNLFRMVDLSEESVLKEIELWNKTFNKYDIFFRQVARTDRGSLVFVYRRKKLMTYLSQDAVNNFLKSLNYQTNSLEKCLACVSEKLSCGLFPHEIGCFLGYPFEDVEGFIKNKGQNYLCCGYWKVYYKKEEKEKLFALYDKTRKFYMDTYSKGCDIKDLVRI